MNRPRCLWGFAMPVLVAWAFAANAASYIVLPLIGDELTLVTAGTTTRSLLDTNRYQTVQTKNSALDMVALKAADVAISKGPSTAKVTMILPTDPALYQLKAAWLSSNVLDVGRLIVILKGQLGTEGDTHLIVVLPYRAEPELKTVRGHLGTGKVAGLGFYVNTFQRTCVAGTAQCERGFLAPFANFCMVMVNARDGVIESEEFTAVGSAYSAAQAADLTPWHALSEERKFGLLQGLLRREIFRMMPDLLAKTHH